MIERRCPKCENPIATEDRFCASCGAVLLQEETQQLSPAAKKRPSTGRLLMIFSITIVGLVAAGVLAVYSLVSSVSPEDWAVFTAPEPEVAAPVSLPAAKPDKKTDQQEQPNVPLSDLPELPSTAPANAQIALKGGVKALSNNDLTTFICTVENISGNVCTGVGVEVALYDAASNCIGSNSAWVYRDIQPSEQVRLVFGGLSSPDVRAFCVTKVSSRSASETAEPEMANSPEKKETPADPQAESPLSQGLTLLGNVSKRPVGQSGFYLEGRIRNDSGKKYRSVFVDFVIYDAAGDQIKTASAVTSDFNSGVVWKFSAPVAVTPRDAVSYEISGVTVY